MHCIRLKENFTLECAHGMPNEGDEADGSAFAQIPLDDVEAAGKAHLDKYMKKISTDHQKSV